MDTLTHALQEAGEQILRLLGVAAIGVLVVFAIVLTVLAVSKSVRRSRVEQAIGAPLPRDIAVRADAHGGKPSLKLRYPQWHAHARDGLHDRRSADMGIDEHESTLYLAGYVFTAPTPFAMYRFVLDLRASGLPVPLCLEERIKLHQVTGQREQVQALADSERIVSHFAEHPTGFESYCARLYRALGWQAEATQATNDGGVDIRMTSPEGTSYIVECKCYRAGNTVGRPILQKLVGANATERADRMMVITTSGYSSSACTYAAEQGIELLDGAAVSRLAGEAEHRGEVGDSRVDCVLTARELLRAIPADLRGKYEPMAREFEETMGE